MRFFSPFKIEPCMDVITKTAWTKMTGCKNQIWSACVRSNNKFVNDELIDPAKIKRAEMFIRIIRMNHMRYKRELVQIIKEQDYMIDQEAQDQNQPSNNQYQNEPSYIYNIFTSSQFTKIVIIPNCIKKKITEKGCILLFGES